MSRMPPNIAKAQHINILESYVAIAPSPLNIEGDADGKAETSVPLLVTLAIGRPEEPPTASARLVEVTGMKL